MISGFRLAIRAVQLTQSIPASRLWAIREIVGRLTHGFLWENGGPIVDLQTLVLPGSDVTISETNYINDAGEISGFGTDSNGDQRAILLIPCDEHHPGQCEDYSMIEAAAPQSGTPTAMQPGQLNRLRIESTRFATDSGEAFTFPANQPLRAIRESHPSKRSFGGAPPAFCRSGTACRYSPSAPALELAASSHRRFRSGQA